MIAKILGTIWVLLGILWLIKPEMLKNRLKKKMTKKMRRIVLGVCIVFGVMMTGNVFRLAGIIPKIIGIAGIVITIKAIMLITSKSQEKFFDWWGNRPVQVFRILALVFLFLGISMLVFAK